MVLIGHLGNIVQQNAGKKYFWWLYVLGALSGGVTHSTFQRPSPYIQPEVGSTSVVTSLMTFLAMMNPNQLYRMPFGFYAKAWHLITFIGAFSLLTEPEKQGFSGISAGLVVYTAMQLKMI